MAVATPQTSSAHPYINFGIRQEYDLAGKTVENHLLALYASQNPQWQSALILWLTSSEVDLRKRCVKRLGNIADAEDAVQEIALKLIRSIGQFQGHSTLRTWTISIAENHCLSMIRSRRAHALGHDALNDLIDLETERRTFVNLLEHRETAERVKATLQRMAAKYRVILQLRFFEDLSLAQMASALELSLSAAKMRLYRAMEVFRQKHSLNHS